MRYFLLLLLLLTSLSARLQRFATPDVIYGALFHDVQESGIFPDSKTFVDAVPKKDPASIVADYLAIKNNPAIRFSLQLFVEENFYLPQQPPVYTTERRELVDHINSLWTVLRRKSDPQVKGSSLLSLPYEYIVPGGRFREIYYWDSYFTMLGLKESGEHGLIENMVRNFAHLLQQYGHIPNGNRSYYLSRSQPPFFSLMVELLASVKTDSVYNRFLPALEKEYDYWMDRSAPTRHVVQFKDGHILNRYWDQLSIPRQEAHAEDQRLGDRKKTAAEKALLYRNLRSAAESGWDFSSRWLRDGKNLSTIETTRFIPVDLNCLLYHLEKTLSKAYGLSGQKKKAQDLHLLAEKRKKAINKYCWSTAVGAYGDYHLVKKSVTGTHTLAGMSALFLQVADPNRARYMQQRIASRFLKPGGVVTSLSATGQQWDAPNGWAPLQWITIIGLENYGHHTLAKDIAARWYRLNKKVFESTGKLMEKYDVVHAGREGGGGEYPSQDGFGWTNGVLLALIRKYKLP